MDLGLYLRVVWRFRVLVLFGLALATSLAFLSFVKVGPDGVSYRQSEIWTSTTRLLVTQSGFPEGRLYGQVPPTVAQPEDPIVDPGRFNNLAVLYSQLATSDPVRLLMLRDGPMLGEVVANPVVAGGEFKTQLPMIDLTAFDSTPLGAMALAERSAKALSTYIREQQRASRVPPADRAVIVPVVRPANATLFQPRSKTMPIVVFVAVAFLTVALAFVLENLRPRLTTGEIDEAPRPEAGGAAVERRRTA